MWSLSTTLPQACLEVTAATEHVQTISASLITTGVQPTTSLPSCGNRSGLIAGVVVAVVVSVATAIVVATILAIWIIKRHNRPIPVNEKPSSGPVYEEVELSLKPASETIHIAANMPTPLPSALCEIGDEEVGAIAAPHIALHAKESHGQTTTPVELKGNPCYGTK